MSDFDSVKYKNDFIKKNYDRINLTVPKGKKEQIKDAASLKGMSVNEYINAALDAFMTTQEG